MTIARWVMGLPKSVMAELWADQCRTQQPIEQVDDGKFCET